jgi:hypothetical protein
VDRQRHAPATLLQERESVSILHEAGWTPRPVSTGRENLASPVFDPRTFQHVASRYTDYATPPHFIVSRTYSNFNVILKALNTGYHKMLFYAVKAWHIHVQYKYNSVPANEIINTNQCTKNIYNFILKSLLQVSTLLGHLQGQ